MTPACKGCHLPITAGQLRRGDDWHAACFSALEASIARVRAPKPPRIKGLTETQVIILTAAAASPSGTIGFGAGDRRGTRVAGFDDLGRPWIKAYSNPEYWLLARGLLERANERHMCRITEAGRAMLPSAEA